MTKMFENAIKAVKPQGALASSIIPDAYDIGCDDMSDLLEMAMSGKSDSVYRALALAFEFGFVMGNRATHSRKLRRL